MLFNSQYLRAPYVIVNRREFNPNIYDNLFSKNVVFGKRFTIKTALLTTGLRVEKPNRRSAIMFLVGNKNYLNVIINLPSINTLTEHLAIVLYLSCNLTDSFGNIVSPGIDTANIFNTEFVDNFSPIDAPPISHDSSGHQFNIICLTRIYSPASALCPAHLHVRMVYRRNVFDV